LGLAGALVGLGGGLLGLGGLFDFGGAGEGLGTDVDLGGGGARRARSPESSASTPSRRIVSMDAETSTVAKRHEINPLMKRMIEDNLVFR
jgi:hypothetical protein